MCGTVNGIEIWDGSIWQRTRWGPSGLYECLRECASEGIIRYNLITPITICCGSKYQNKLKGIMMVKVRFIKREEWFHQRRAKRSVPAFRFRVNMAMNEIRHTFHK